MSHKALVVIDIQNDITKHYRDIIDRLNAAIDWAAEQEMDVVYIKHNNLSPGTRTFKPDSKGAELVPELKIVSEKVYVKTKANALTSEEFSAYIRENGINEFFITGASYRKIFVIGEMELLDPHFIPFFVEAATEVTTVALHIGQNREQLMKDPVFLRMLCVSLSKKLEDATQQSERLPLKTLVRNSMRDMEPGECITGIGKLAESVNVSSRQLIRVLNEYCELGILNHEKHGVYRMIRKLPAMSE